MILTALLAVVALHQDTSRIEPPPRIVRRDSAVLVDTLVRAERAYFDAWRTAWMGSKKFEMVETSEPGLSLGQLARVHCHPAESGDLIESTPVVISSRQNAQAQCPGWLRGGADRRESEDSASTLTESVQVDLALDVKARDGLAKQRSALVHLFDVVHRQLPTHPWIIGQRIRLLVDAGELGRALDVARSCQAQRSWCAALTGHVLHAQGESLAAESAFVAARDAMTPEERCAWTDIGVLLDSAARHSYARMSCAEHLEINAMFWWMADPMLGEAGNARLVEHYARLVRITLHSALSQDERYDWRPAMGGDAVAEMMLRYGWPTSDLWAGPSVDRSHTRWLAMHRMSGHAPFLTADYSPDRLHLSAAWSAVLDPFGARESDWSLNHPVGRPYFPVWPAEHVLSSRALVQLPSGQSVVLRRDSTLLLAVSTMLHDQTLAPLGDSLTAMLLTSPRPDTIRIVAQRRARNGASLVLSGVILAEPALVGVEIPGRGRDGASARLRFGLFPPSTLSAMAKNEVAVSEPVLLDAGAAAGGEASAIDDAGVAISRMLGSVRLKHVDRLGVFFESYGLQSGDTVDVSVRIERSTAPTTLHRIGMALRVSDDPNGAVEVKWREPQPGRSSRSISAGRVPVQARSLTLNIARLKRGDYTLDVTIGKPGVPPARSRRAFVIE